MENLTFIEIVALSKVVKDKALKAARPECTVGEHPIDFSVSVKGMLRVLEDTEKTPTCNIPWKTVAAILIAKMGCTRDAAEKQLVGIIAEALRIGDGVGMTMYSAYGDALAAAENHIDTTILAKLPKVKVKGACSFVGKVTSPEPMGAIEVEDGLLLNVNGLQGIA